jgi:regulatory protein
MAFARSKAPVVHDESSLYEYAVAALGRKMRSTVELRTLLKRRAGAQPNTAAMIEAVLARLREQKYLNDAGFAASYASYRKENERFGRQRVAQDLLRKGVEKQTAARALDEIYAGQNDEELARAFLKRKRIQPPADDKAAARIYRMLARAGYSLRTASQILRNWQVGEETVSLLEEQRLEAEEHPPEETE